MARCGWAPSHAASPSSRSRERVSSTPPPRLTRDGAPRSATVEGRDHLRGQPFELLEHALGRAHGPHDELRGPARDRKSTRLNSSHTVISYAVFCLKKKKKTNNTKKR